MIREHPGNIWFERLDLGGESVICITAQGVRRLAGPLRVRSDDAEAALARMKQDYLDRQAFERIETLKGGV